MSLFDDIAAAHVRVRPQVAVTPLERSHVLSAAFGCEVMLKCDHLQPTGSFKIRGATNRVMLLTPDERGRGVTTASTGNYGKAVARAAGIAGVAATVYVSNAASRAKIDAISALGAEVIELDGHAYDAEVAARAAAVDSGRVYLAPYNDIGVVAGQGTIGVELFEQAPDLDAVFIAVGGGGLIGGAGTALKHLNPATDIVATWAEHSPCMLRALEAGGIVDVVEHETWSDGTLGAIEPGSVTYPICRDVIDARVTVSEAEIADAMRRVAASDNWLVEGSAGVALAGFMQTAERYRGKTVAVVLCGRNVALDTYLAAIGG